MMKITNKLKTIINIILACFVGMAFGYMFYLGV